MNRCWRNPTAPERAQSGAAGAPLSAEQKRRACMLAREAWERQGRPGYSDQAGDLPAEIRLTETEAFTTWRQDEQGRGTGCRHLTCMEQRFFPHVMAHFAGLDGRERDAEYWRGRTVGDQQRQALAKLRSEEAAARDVIEDPHEYVCAIARCKYKTMDIESLSPRAIWTLVFDLRRGAQHRRKHVEGVPF